MAVLAVDGWYARNMYIQGSTAYKYHLKNFGHPSEFGYKDLILLWKAEKFDPDKLVKIFKNAGAKYITPVAVHHDNFDLWDSKHHKWNAVNMGPQKDIIGSWKKSVEKHGLKWGVTTHLSRAYSWFQTSHGADKKGPKKGIPYDGKDPKYHDLYFNSHGDDDLRSPKNPPESWRRQWIARIKDLINNYDPEILYYDASIPFRGDDGGKSGLELMAYFYNHNLKITNDKSNGILFIKKIPDHGVYREGVANLDIEGKASDQLLDEPWQTDLEIGHGWFYNNKAKYKKLLKQIGRWMKVNGRAIYGTRPWKKARENNIYFTKKENHLYIFLLGKAKRKLKIQALGSNRNSRQIQEIKFLESNQKVDYEQKEHILVLKKINGKYTPPLRVLDLVFEGMVDYQ